MEQEQIARRIRELGVILESQDNRIRGLEKDSKSLVEANAGKSECRRADECPRNQCRD